MLSTVIVKPVPFSKCNDQVELVKPTGLVNVTCVTLFQLGVPPVELVENA